MKYWEKKFSLQDDLHCKKLDYDRMRKLVKLYQSEIFYCKYILNTFIKDSFEHKQAEKRLKQAKSELRNNQYFCKKAKRIFKISKINYDKFLTEEK